MIKRAIVERRSQTPRWIAFDAKFFAMKMPEGTKTVVQDRADTSPIWDPPQPTDRFRFGSTIGFRKERAVVAR